MIRRKGLLLLLIVLAITISCASHSALETTEAIPIPKESIVYHDGDTISFDDITIRILGIDTPEIAHPRWGQHEGQPFGDVAATRAEELIRGANRVTYLPYQKDRYDRLLAHIFIDGNLMGIQLIKEGLAYETISYYGDNGFPDIAASILKAAENAPEPQFKNPHIWRREQREKSQVETEKKGERQGKE